MTAPTVYAIGTRRNNAELMADCAALGYLDMAGPCLDMTYGLGRFWSKVCPPELDAIDLDPERAGQVTPAGTLVHCADFTATPYGADAFATVVLDGPYKLNGTTTGAGPSASDADYGVADYQTPAARHALICRGITEAHRITAPGGHVLVKCQDQVSSGRVYWQTDIFTRHAEGLGLVKRDALHVTGCRAQPAGRRQVHARRDYSTLLVFRKATR